MRSSDDGRVGCAGDLKRHKMRSRLEDARQKERHNTTSRECGRWKRWALLNWTESDWLSEEVWE